MPYQDYDMTLDYTEWRHPHPYELKNDGLMMVETIEQ